jgi:hypothetical protein
MVVRGTQVAKAFGHGFQDPFNFDHRFEGITIDRARFLFFAVFVAGSFPIFGPVPWTLVLKAGAFRALIPGLSVVPGFSVVPRFSVVPGLPVVPRLPFFPKGTQIARAGIGTLGAIVTKICGIVIRFG